MVIQTETDWYNLCFRHRRPPVSKYASSREKTISSRGRIKWTFKKKMHNCLGFHSEWNSRSGTKFHFGTCQWKRTSFRLKNRKSCCLGRAAHAYLIWRENHESQNALGYELPFRTTVILVWKSFRYHVKSWGLDHFMNTNITVGKNDFVT